MVGWDVFISYAHEDKPWVKQLAQGLTQRGVSVWFDETVLTLGDSLLRKIDQGLSHSRFGVVVLSPAFFNKAWPRRELDGLTTRELASDQKIVLPIWHGVTAQDVAYFSPPLADKLAISTERGLDAVVDSIVQAVGTASPTSRPAATGGQPQPPASPGQPPSSPALQKALVELYSFDELQDLVFRLELDHEDIPGTNKSAYARELVGYMQRRGRLQQLVAALRADRPHWTG